MLFRFKQFEVDQTGCAMKINTDGVLLGALAGNGKPANILDIGTGTGVIALMMAQRFPDAVIDAVEIDITAAQTAASNFAASPFRDKLTVYATGFEVYFEAHAERKYNVIISNPPFYINSLISPGAKINLAKHADGLFFEKLISGVAKHFANNGVLWLILPIPTADLVKNLAFDSGLFIQQITTIHSFADSDPHREIIAFGLSQTKPTLTEFVIYDAPKVYSQQCQNCLKDFFTIF